MSMFAFWVHGIFVAHAAYFGLTFVMLATAWPDVARCVRARGVGLVIAVSLGVVLSLNCESRYLMGSLPLVAPFLAKVLDLRPTVQRFAMPLVLVNVALSRAYLPVLDWNARVHGFRLGQTYQDHNGPWMTDEGWLIALATTLAMLFVLAYVGWLRGPTLEDARVGGSRASS